MNQDSPKARRFNGLLLVACSLVSMFAELSSNAAYGQKPDIVAVHVRSIGQPPEAASRFVADRGIPNEVPLSQSKSIETVVKELCGHASKSLLERTAALNAALVTTLGGTAAPAEAATTMLLPACIRSFPSWRASTRPNDGIGQVVKREFNLPYDPNDAGWVTFASEVCKLNQSLAGFSCAASAVNPKLPIASIRLPAAVARSQIKIDTTNTSLDAILADLTKELKAAPAPGTFFKFDVPERAPAVALPQVLQCSTDIPTEYAYDLNKLLKLVSVYTGADGRKLDSASQRTSVITVIDTGIEPQNVVLNDLLFKRSIVPGTDALDDSSNADVAFKGSTASGYPRGSYGTVSPAEILYPDKVTHFHGTHVAGLAMGRALATDVLAADDETRGLGPFWPRLRVFRSLRKNLPSGKYDISAGGIAAGLNFVLDRAGPSTEYNVVNISIGSSELADMKSRIESLGNNVVVVAAAGNYGLDLMTEVDERYPAAFGGSDNAGGAFVISVAAAKRNGDPLAYSNFSATNVDLFAVGDCQYSFTDGTADKTALTGTSQAAPWVALTAALLYQMPLPSKHPSLIKNRIVSAVRSDPRLTGQAESRGHLDPFRTVDVLVDHLRIRMKDGSDQFVRALIDYDQSEKPCSGMIGVRNVARYQKFGDEAWYRPKQLLNTIPAPNQVAYPPSLRPCGKMNPKAKIRYYADDDFEKLARKETVSLREVEVADVIEIIPRMFENIGSVATAPARDDAPFKPVLRETTRALKE